MLLVACLGIPLAAQSETPISETLKDQLTGCLACHKGGLAFTGKPAREVLEGIRQIRDGVKPHPPGLNDFKEEDLGDISAFLAGETESDKGE